MQYLDWADIQIPLCLVTGFSYAKRSRIVNHARNFASARGFEASEISVRVTLNRGVAMAYGLEFGRYVELLESFDASKDNPQGTVTLGGYPIYPELNFALTNINRTYQTDLATDDITVLEADITLSGVSCVKDALDAHFDKKGFEWKTRESQTEHTQAKPTIFALVCAERNAANFPEVCPSVTIALREASAAANAVTLNIACHCVVVNSAILESEKTVKKSDHFEFLDSDGYSEKGVKEALFADSLLLAEETMNALRGIEGVTNIKLLPSDTLDEFPYCQSCVTATLTALTQFIPRDLL